LLLINPSISKSSQIELLTKFIYTSFPTSIGFLAGYLREHNGFTPEIIDEHIRPLSDEQLKEALDRMDVGIVGMSCMTLTISRGFELARKIKEMAPDTIVIMGGIHPTVLPDDCFQTGMVDIVVKGEGEQTLSELYELIKAGKPYEDVAGIVYPKDGKVVHNLGRPLIKDIDDIPEFPYDLFENDRDKYKDFGTMVTSRGCPFDCIFCSQRAISGKAFRYASIERSMSEIDKLINKYGVKTIWFNEDSFAINRKRVFAMCEAIIERGFHKQAEFIAELRADSTDRELLTKMYEANFTMLACGAETGSERLMKIINKKETVEQNNEFIRLASEIGIKVSTTYIFGFPTETKEERRETFKLSQRLPLDNVRFNTAIPYPGTYIYELAKQEGRLHVLDEWKNFNVQYYAMFDDLPYYPRGMTKYDLIYDTMMSNVRTYVSVRGITTLLKSPLTGGGVVSLPENWSFADIVDGVKLALFLTKRFFYIVYKAKVEPLFKEPLGDASEDAANPELVAEAMESAAAIYTEKVSADKSVKRGAIKNVAQSV
jgi:anaerobic magnesium-protoporphyrin IX monomethyl ester cyclase